jgi:hypothetical protein
VNRTNNIELESVAYGTENGAIHSYIVVRSSEAHRTGSIPKGKK